MDISSITNEIDWSIVGLMWGIGVLAIIVWCGILFRG